MNTTWALLGASVSSALAAAVCVFFVMRYYSQQGETLHQAAREALAQELKTLENALRQTIDRLKITERQVRELMDRQNRLEMTAPSTERFKHAIALAQRGASTEELMATCALARGEAELLFLLHRSSHAPRAADKLA
ncbi:MAG: DUF2802 domain-containing protein [Gammaproteobacteria bacterium]